MPKTDIFSRALAGAGAAALVFNIWGCSFLGYVSTDLSVSLTNDSNRLLTVEGKTSLPDGMPLRITLKEDGETISGGRTVVKNGRFAETVDLSGAPGNCMLNLDIVADPSEASPEVQDIVGSRGEYLLGEQLEDIDGSTCVTEHKRIILPMDKREVAIRRVRCGDYNLGIVGLENVLSANPDDQEAKAWMAYALLNNDPRENEVGSRAYDLLHSVNVRNLPEPLRSGCVKWLGKWEIKETAARKERERKANIARTNALLEAKKKVIEPGVGLGGVYIGATARDVYKLAIPDKYPAWTDGAVYYKMPDRDVEVFFDSKSGRVIEAHTANTLYSLRGDVGVGSKIESVKKYFPEGRLEMDEAKPQQDGSFVAFGKYLCPEGIIFDIKRILGNDGVVVSERVRGMSVVAPFAVDLESPDDSAVEAEAPIDFNEGKYPKFGDR
ncbi:hypothetical protein IJT93_08875 [bacterium]|nr:hypothetical protein [bacterium]